MILGSITWSYDDKYFSILSWINHRAKKIYRHKLDTPITADELIFEEMDDRFTCGIGTSSDEKFYFITTSEHTTSEVHFFSRDEKTPKPRFF